MLNKTVSLSKQHLQTPAPVTPLDENYDGSSTGVFNGGSGSSSSNNNHRAFKYQQHVIQQQQQQQQQIAPMPQLYASPVATSGYGLWRGGRDEQKLTDMAASAIDDVRAVTVAVSGDLDELRRVVTERLQVMEAMRHQLVLVSREAEQHQGESRREEGVGGIMRAHLNGWMGGFI